MLNEDEEIRSPKRKVIQVEFEETREYLKEGKEYGAGKGGREDLRTERGEPSSKDFVSL